MVTVCVFVYAGVLCAPGSLSSRGVLAETENSPPSAPFPAAALWAHLPGHGTTQALTFS